MNKYVEYTERHPENKRAKFFKKIIQRRLKNCHIDSLGIVSCQNPDPVMRVDYSDEDNANAVVEMNKILTRRGYKYLQVDGIYQGSGEVSFIIANIEKDDIEELSNLNFQKSYIWGRVDVNEKGKKFLNLYMRARPNKETPYKTVSKNGPHPANEFHKPDDDDYYTHMNARIDWVGLFDDIEDLTAEVGLPKELRECFERIYEECVCAGTGAGSISSFVPEHMRGVFCAGSGGGYGLATKPGKKVDTTDARRDSTPRATHKIKYAKDLKDGESFLSQMVLDD